MGTDRKRNPAAAAVLGFALAASAALATVLAVDHLLGARPRESVGSAELEPRVPDGHPASLTVRLRLPTGFFDRGIARKFAESQLARALLAFDLALILVAQLTVLERF